MWDMAREMAWIKMLNIIEFDSWEALGIELEIEVSFTKGSAQFFLQVAI